MYSKLDVYFWLYFKSNGLNSEMVDEPKMFFFNQKVSLLKEMKSGSPKYQITIWMRYF